MVDRTVAGIAERFVVNDGVRIRYLERDADEAVGLPLVFVPGITDFADDYEAMLEWIDRRLVIIEMRGRGGSDAPPAGYSVQLQATDVEAVLADAGIDRFHLMTFSRGTTPAIEVALRNRDRVETLSIGDYLAVEVELPPEFVDMQWQTRWRGRPIPERVQRHVIEGIQRESRGRELWDDVAGLGLPVLVARGGSGGILNDDIVAKYRAHVPGVEVVDIDGAGHDLFRPDRLAYPRAVLDFIARRAPGT